MPTMADQTHNNNLREKEINFNDFEKYIKSLETENLGAKIYFNDDTYIKGFIVSSDAYNIFLMHKNNIILVSKRNMKMIEPLGKGKEEEDEEEKNKEEAKETK